MATVVGALLGGITAWSCTSSSSSSDPELSSITSEGAAEVVGGGTPELLCVGGVEVLCAGGALDRLLGTTGGDAEYWSRAVRVAVVVLLAQRGSLVGCSPASSPSMPVSSVRVDTHMPRVRHPEVSTQVDCNQWQHWIKCYFVTTKSG